MSITEIKNTQQNSKSWSEWTVQALSPGRVVWLIWLLLSINLIRYVAIISHPVPVWDDWAYVPWVTGAEPVTLEWLWAPHNDHRMPIGKVLLLILIPFFDGDFRAEVFFNIACMILAAAGMMAVAARLRGRYAYSDAFFPLALLHCGHIDMYLGIGTITHSVAVLAGLGLLAMILIAKNSPTRMQVIVAGICMLTIPLCGAAALPLVPAGICWLGLVGFQKYRKTGILKHATFDWSIALAGAILLGLYFVGFTGDDKHGRAATIQEFLTISAQASTMMILPAQWMQKYWPFIFLIVPGTAFAAVVRLSRQSIKFSSSDWLPSVGTLLFLLASFVPALAIGWSRGFVGPLAGTATRYGFFLFPMIATVYLAFVAFDQKRLSRAVPIILCLVAVVGLRYNLKKTYASAIVYHNTREAFVSDVEAGLTVEELATKYSGHETSDLTNSENALLLGCRAMRDSKFGIFAKIQESQPVQSDSHSGNPK